MNRIIISIVILAVISVLSFTGVSYINSFSRNMISKLDEVEEAFSNGDTERSAAAAKELRDAWHRFLDYAVLVNDSGHAIEITSAIAQVYSFAQEGNEELYASCDSAQAQIELFCDMQIPTLWKIL